jgi:hypothetical protein
MKEYKLRIGAEVPEATSETVASWLDEALKTGVSLAADPGGGEFFCNLSLDESKVMELANRHGCKTNVVLRRLIAGKVSLAYLESSNKRSAGAMIAEILPGKVLPKKLEYKEADLLPVVRGLDSGMVLLYRRLYGLPELKTVRTPEADRELASAMAECVNRRSPEWLLANADLVKLTFSFVRWSFAQTDELEKQVSATKEKAHRKNVNESAANASGPLVDTTNEIDQSFDEAVHCGERAK